MKSVRTCPNSLSNQSIRKREDKREDNRIFPGSNCDSDKFLNGFHWGIEILQNVCEMSNLYIYI